MLVLLDWDNFSPSSATPDEAMLGFNHVRRTRLSISRRDFVDKERRTRSTPWPPALSSTCFSLTREREKRGRKLKFYLRNWLVPEKIRGSDGLASGCPPSALRNRIYFSSSFTLILSFFYITRRYVRIEMSNGFLFVLRVIRQSDMFVTPKYYPGGRHV